MSDIAQVVFKAIDYGTMYLENSKRYRDVTVDADISYNDAYERTKMDVRYLKGTKKDKKPVVVYIAGGGFVAGGRKFRPAILEFFAQEGYCAICPDLRLAPQFSFPTPLFDLVNALNFINDNLKDEYNLDMDNVVVSGDSAGGYFSSFAVAITTHPTLATDLGLPECKVKINALLGLCGVYDFVKMVSIPEPLGVAINTARDFAGYKFKRDFSNFSEYPYKNYISPINFINDNWCKSLIVYGKKDIFCYGQGETMSAKLTEHGIPHEVSFGDRFINNHCYFLFRHTKAARRTYVDMQVFLRKLKDGIYNFNTLPALSEKFEGKDVAELKENIETAVNKRYERFSEHINEAYDRIKALDKNKRKEYRHSINDIEKEIKYFSGEERYDLRRYVEKVEIQAYLLEHYKKKEVHGFICDTRRSVEWKCNLTEKEFRKFCHDAKHGKVE